MPHENIKLKYLTIAAAGLIGLLLADTVWAHHPAGTGGKLVFRLSSDIGSFNSIRTPVNNDTRNNPLAAMRLPLTRTSPVPR